MRQLLIQHASGLWHVHTPKVEAAGTSLEKAIANADPGAPPEKVTACAEILTGLIGTEDRGHVVTGLMDDS